MPPVALKIRPGSRVRRQKAGVIEFWACVSNVQQQPGACRSLQGFPGAGGRREALQGGLHPAKKKITKAELQEKKTELHRKSESGRRGRQDRRFRRSTAKVEGLESNASKTYQNTKQADMPWAGKDRERRRRKGGL